MRNEKVQKFFSKLNTYTKTLTSITKCVLSTHISVIRSKKCLHREENSKHKLRHCRKKKKEKGKNRLQYYIFDAITMEKHVC